MKLLFSVLAAAFVVAPVARSESAADLTRWKVEGAVQNDAGKTGPNGAPSFKISPKSKAVLKLRDTDCSGKLSFFVYDDGTVSGPEKKKSVGPRWGMSAADGQLLLGAIMYNPHLPPGGANCLFDTDLSQKDPWLAFKYLSPRGAAGWKKWEFDYQPKAGLKIKVDGKEVDQRHFDWNTSKAIGFNSIVFFGDDASEGTPQTVWVSDIQYELGPPMEVKPGGAVATQTPAPAPAATPSGPSPEEQAERSAASLPPGKMTGFIPGPTLLDDIKTLRVPLLPNYSAQHPRLLFSKVDRSALQKKAQDHADLWNRVLASAKGVIPKESVPDLALISSGGKYWRVEKVESAALAWFVTGDNAYRDGAIRWMVAHCKEKMWGNTFRPNVDLPASWYLYHLAVAYDILKDEIGVEDRAIIRDGLAEHARLVYADLDPVNPKDKFRYDQNHTYIPTIALTATGLALLEDVPDAKHWLTRAYAVLRRSRYVQPEDGYYYEGFGYWGYALHWHVRGAEMLERATGEPLFNIPVLHDTWRFGLQLSLPGTPRAFDIGDVDSMENGKRRDIVTTNTTMMWGIASQTNGRESQLVGNQYDAIHPETDYPASAFLWFDPAIKPAALDQITPYQYFSDVDVVTWRSSWKDDATCYFFRSGPPLGHKAMAKLGQLKDWTMNAGHVHADIGGFLMYAKGTYLAGGTGYTAEKWTRDQNTLLVDDKGQGQDGSYHNDRGIPYEDFNGAQIDRQFLSPAYGYASGEFGSAYRHQIKGVKLRRSLLMTERWLLIVDDMDADAEHKLTWICHADSAFQPEGGSFVSHQTNASLAVVPLAPGGLQAQPDETVVMAGKAPEHGTKEKHGFQLHLVSPSPVKTTRFVNLLLPLDSNERAPKVEGFKNEGSTISFKLVWATGKTETVRLSMDWKNGGADGPAAIETK